MNILTKRVLKQIINEQVNKAFKETGNNDVYNYKKEITFQQLVNCFENILAIIAKGVATKEAGT